MGRTRRKREKCKTITANPGLQANGQETECKLQEANSSSDTGRGSTALNCEGSEEEDEEEESNSKVK